MRSIYTSMPVSNSLGVFVLAVLSLVVLTPVTKAQDNERGRVLFMEHCAACHGTNAKGDGPVAESLKTKPADLTQIPKKDGKFDYFHVKAFIDGERVVSAHGSREMPIWGYYFRRTRGKQLAALDIENLVEYVRSIQEEKEP